MPRRSIRLWVMALAVFFMSLNLCTIPGIIPGVIPGVMAATKVSREEGRQSSGAIYCICTPEPEDWNGDLVIFAHGYVSPDKPIEIPEDQLSLPDGTCIPDIINNLGYAFATTSYSTNGLAVLEGVEDLRELVEIFIDKQSLPRYVYLVGASEGGLITALAVEQFPEIFNGGLSACGPVGDFVKQINYWGDFRVIFDYFFPDLIPGDAVNIPQEVIDNWETLYVPRIEEAIRANRHDTLQLLRVTKAPIDHKDRLTIDKTVLDILWYNVSATTDSIEKLGGQPFDNQSRFYFGSNNDFALNSKVRRFTADQVALDEIEAHYQTSGRLSSPLVTLHTTGDPIVPCWHEPLYRLKTSRSIRQHTNIPIRRYGHCNFKINEVLAGFELLVFKVSGQVVALNR